MGLHILGPRYCGSCGLVNFGYGPMRGGSTRVCGTFETRVSSSPETFAFCSPTKKMRNGDCEGNFGPSLPPVDKGHHRALSSSSVPSLHLWSTTVLLFVESTTRASLLPRSTTIASLLPRSSSSIYHCSFTSSSIYHHLPSTQVYDFFLSVDTS